MFNELKHTTTRNMSYLVRSLKYLTEKTDEGKHENNFGKYSVYGIPTFCLGFGQLVLIPIALLEATLESTAINLYRNVRRHPLATI